MSNLLKEAIADAKAVRATALANAKAALEEAFQPKLEAMLAEKLKNEIADSSDMENSDPMGDNDGMPLTVDESQMEITDDELNEILAELEGELDEAGQVDPNVPVAPAPAPVDPMAQAPAPVAEDTQDDEIVDLQELLDSLNDDEFEGEEITEGEEEEDEDKEVD